MNIKELLCFNCKWIFLLIGMVLGLLLSVILMSNHQKFQLMELDLKKIIHTYSLHTSKSTKSMHEIQEEFKAKFNLAIDQMPSKTILFTKGGLLSKHPATDYTDAFMKIMGIDQSNEHESN